jgi:hypothetical protein
VSQPIPHDETAARTRAAGPGDPDLERQSTLPDPARANLTRAATRVALDRERHGHEKAASHLEDAAAGLAIGGNVVAYVGGSSLLPDEVRPMKVAGEVVAAVGDLPAIWNGLSDIMAGRWPSHPSFFAASTANFGALVAKSALDYIATKYPDSTQAVIAKEVMSGIAVVTTGLVLKSKPEAARAIGQDELRRRLEENGSLHPADNSPPASALGSRGSSVSNAAASTAYTSGTQRNNSRPQSARSADAADQRPGSPARTNPGRHRSI